MIGGMIGGGPKRVPGDGDGNAAAVRRRRSRPGVRDPRSPLDQKVTSGSPKKSEMKLMKKKPKKTTFAASRA
jgi:hypothetical protein